MLWQRSEWLYEQQPVSSAEVYLDLVGRELHELCVAFPPAVHEVDFLDQRMQNRFAPLLPSMRHLSSEQMLLLADLLQWELERDLPCIDDFMAQQRYRPIFDTPADVEAMHFLHRLLLDRLLERLERNNFALKRKDLQRTLDVLRRHVRHAS